MGCRAIDLENRKNQAVMIMNHQWKVVMGGVCEKGCKMPLEILSRGLNKNYFLPPGVL